MNSQQAEVELLQPMIIDQHQYTIGKKDSRRLLQEAEKYSYSAAQRPRIDQQYIDAFYPA